MILGQSIAVEVLYTEADLACAWADECVLPRRCQMGVTFGDDFFNRRGPSEASKRILALQQVELTS